MPRQFDRTLPCLAVAAALALSPLSSLACTRVVYLGAKDDVITARSMDWKLDVATNLYVLPRGITRPSTRLEAMHARHVPGHAWRAGKASAESRSTLARPASLAPRHPNQCLIEAMSALREMP